ncbi:MAG: hypothetical protein K0Q72_3358, partial [Armatimonadetes bacterium]|nr:hypothetical protein [Armatimonadota bacterium]
MSLVCNLIERTLARHAAAGTDLPPGIERHLEGCSSCRQCLAELTALGERLSASVTLPEAPPDLTEPARLLLASGAVRPARRPAPRLAVGGLAAGVLMVGALAGRWLPGSRTARRPEPQPPVPAAASTQAGPAGPVAAHPAPRLEAPEPRRRRVPVQEPTTSRFTGVTGGSPTLGSAAEDSRYLNGEDQELQRYWLGNRASSELRRLWTTKLPPMRDDFVLPRPVLLASTGSAGVRKAADEYTKEAAVVDARLFKKVTLGLKGASLLELCEVLQKETGVRFQPARITADEKVTVFVTDRPTRDVMRQVARLFGFVWARSGESGAYRYELVQTLRAQLTEEEMRQQDQNGALLALDARMQADAALLDLPLTELKARAKEGPQSERERAGLLLRGGWGGAQLFRRLSLPDLLRLRGGQEVTHQIFTDDPASRLPPEWKPALLETG